MSDQKHRPVEGQRYEDVNVRGRYLVVTRVDLNDRAGRDVVGRLYFEGEADDYSCSVVVFETVWQPAAAQPGGGK